MSDLKKFRDEIFFEDVLVDCNADVIGYAPMFGYRAWLFKVNKSYVILHDVGNCWYSYGRDVNPVWCHIVRIYNYLDIKFSGFWRYLRAKN